MVKIAHINAAGIVVNMSCSSVPPETGAQDAIGNTLAVCVSGRIGDIYIDGRYITPQQVPDMDKAAVIQAEIISEAFDRAANNIIAQYPAIERDSWPKQEAEARAYLADTTSPTPLLTAIATARGISVADLAARVIANADVYAVAGGEIIGRKQARMDAISAAVASNDVAALQAVVW